MERLEIDNSNVQILIVDDNEANILLLDSLLRQVGYQVTKAYDGQQALERVQESRPDLILLDIMMPNMDGYDACRMLKSNSETSDIPIIFLSAKSKREDIIQGLQLGAVDYMTKPFNRVELLLRVETQIELKLSRDKLREIALKDGLTDLYNHTHILDRLQQEISRASRHNEQLSVILLDLDHFKKVNDTFGHQAGDLVLKAFAGLITAQLRNEDIAGRYGGEEFLLVLPQSDLNAAECVAEKLRSSIQEYQWPDEYASLSVTLSAGVAQWAGEKETELVDKADQRLYRAKDEGRNRVVSE